MQVEIRVYAGFAGQAGRFAAVRDALESLLLPVAGLERFQLLETNEGFALVVSGEDRAGCEECLRRAQAWLEEKSPTLIGHRPLVVRGEVIAETRGLVSRAH